MNKLLIILCVMFVMCGAVTNIQAKTVKVNLLINGNFDAWPGIPWIEYSSAGWLIICSIVDAPLPTLPHSGPYLAWLGGGDNLNDYLYQDIVIPIRATDLTINLWRFISTMDNSLTYDQAVLSLRNPTTNQVLEMLKVWTSNDIDLNCWRIESIPIPEKYAGIPVRIFLSSSNNYSGDTNFLFDTISLDATIKVGSTTGALLLLLD